MTSTEPVPAVGAGPIPDPPARDDVDGMISWFKARDAANEANAPKVIPPCPPWCRHKELFADGIDPNHEYDSVVEPGTYLRFHVSGPGRIYVAQEEFNRDGVIELGPLHLAGVGDREETTAAEARQMAAELLNAADRLDAIAASGQ